MRRIICTLILTAFTFAEANAQAVVVRKRDLNSSSAPISPSIRSSAVNGMNGGLYYSRYNHAVKFSPVALFAGDIPLSYERKMNDYFTLEAGLGLTTFNLTEDLIRGYSNRGDGETVSKLSYSGLFNAKFFPEGNAFQDGYYIAFNLNQRNYAQDFNTTSNNTGMDTTVNEMFRWSDIGFTLGYQSRPSERMILDWFIGAAIRQKSRKTTDLVQEFDPTSGLFINSYVLNESRNTTPALLAGVKISVLFR